MGLCPTGGVGAGRGGLGDQLAPGWHSGEGHPVGVVEVHLHSTNHHNPCQAGRLTETSFTSRCLQALTHDAESLHQPSAVHPISQKSAPSHTDTSLA